MHLTSWVVGFAPFASCVLYYQSATEELLQALLKITAGLINRSRSASGGLTPSSRISDVWPAPSSADTTTSLSVSSARHALARQPVELMPVFLERACSFAEEGGYQWLSLGDEFKYVLGVE